MSVDTKQRLFTYCAALFDLMQKESDPIPGGDGLVWSGRITHATASVGIPTGTYKRVVDRLREMGCIEQVERGFRGDALSVFLVHYPPTEEVWDRFVKSARSGLTDGPTLDSLSASVKEIQYRLGGLHIADALKNHENRIKELEDQFKKFAAQTNDKPQ